jgi:hypothetical protein
METGIVVDNFDPTYKGRCRIRVYGRHTETVGGEYAILDDDLPWAKPAPSIGSSGGNFNIPKVGQRVSVEVVDQFTILYHGPIETNGGIQDLLYENADDCENTKVVLFDGEKDSDYVRIYYIPEKGLNIECHGHKILLTKYDGLQIEAKNGVKISIDDSSKDVNINTTGTVNLNAKNVNLTEDASEKLILGSKLMEKFNTHTHFCPAGATAPPTTKITPLDFSKKIKIG